MIFTVIRDDQSNWVLACFIPMTSPPPLTIQNATCAYGNQLVLDDISLTLHAGEILGVKSDEGAGLSTLLKAILSLVTLKTGRILVFSQQHDTADSRAQLAYLPEEPQTPGHLTGCDVVTMARTVQGKSKDAIEELAMDLDLPLKRLIFPTRDYSREDVQKLTLLTQLAMNRPILVLDQPMTHLSPAARKGLGCCLRNHTRKGGAVLMGSHVIDDFDGLADRLLLLEDGKLQAATSDCPAQRQSLANAG